MIKNAVGFFIAGTVLFLVTVSVLVVVWSLYTLNHVDAPEAGLRIDLERIADRLLKNPGWNFARVQDGVLHFYQDENAFAFSKPGMNPLGVESLEPLALSGFPQGRAIGAQISYLVKDGGNVLFVTGGAVDDVWGWVYSKNGCVEFNASIRNLSWIGPNWYWFDSMSKSHHWLD